MVQHQGYFGCRSLWVADRGSSHGHYQKSAMAGASGQWHYPLRNESAVQSHEFPNELDESVAVESRQSNPLGRLVKSRHVLVWAEQTDLTLLILVSLHTLETLESIMEHASRRVEAKVLVRNDARSVPTIGR